MKRDKQPFEYRSVRYWSKEIDETLTEGRKKIIFLIRDIDRPATGSLEGIFPGRYSEIFGLGERLG